MIVKVTYLVVEFHFGCSFYWGECRRKAGLTCQKFLQSLFKGARARKYAHTRARASAHMHTHMHARTYTRT